MAKPWLPWFFCPHKSLIAQVLSGKLLSTARTGWRWLAAKAGAMTGFVRWIGAQNEHIQQQLGLNQQLGFNHPNWRCLLEFVRMHQHTDNTLYCRNSTGDQVLLVQIPTCARINGLMKGHCSTFGNKCAAVPPKKIKP